MKRIILLLIYIFIFYCLFFYTYSMSIEDNNLVIKNDVLLKELRVNYEGIVPNFQNDIYKYYLTIPEEVKEIEIFATAENPNSTIEIKGNTNLKNGLNIIEIEVISKDKEQRNTYTIEVTKTNNIELVNANLEILAIENVLLSPPFDSNIIDYEAEVSNETEKVKILAIPQNENAKVEIIGEEHLEEGDNLITINVTAPNTFSRRVYTIKLHKRNNEETIQFMKEEQNNHEKLNGIYSVQRTSTKTENKIKRTENNNEKNIKIIIYILISTIVFYIISKLIRILYKKSK